MTILRHLEAFLTALQQQARPNTVRSYRADLSLAARYLTAPLDRISPVDVEAFLTTAPGATAPLSPRLAMRVLQEFSAQEEREEHPPAQEEREDKMNTLTETQQDVLQHVANGYTYREVGDMLGFSEITIKRYMGAIVRKLHVKDRADAIAYVRPDLASDNTP